ncbi:hypothetical protein VZT92_025729 [Zoarces viviparus]|uniref:Uncharacterized protein n=1 Tax=Zoarces viviparus TaxID=48416 RepID=A0AAW1DYY8_ZOAVI
MGCNGKPDRLSYVATKKKTSTITQKNTAVTSAVKQAGQPALFTCGPHVNVDVKEGCGSFEPRGSTSSNHLVFTI